VAQASPPILTLTVNIGQSSDLIKNIFVNCLGHSLPEIPLLQEVCPKGVLSLADYVMAEIN
jgi:hypothetical protein